MDQPKNSTDFLKYVSGCTIVPILTIFVSKNALQQIIKFILAEDRSFNEARLGLRDWNGSKQTLELLTTTANAVTRDRLPNYLKLVDKLEIRNHHLVQKCELEGFDRVYSYIGERSAQAIITFNTKQSSELTIYIKTEHNK